jgi:hypothetical protein
LTSANWRRVRFIRRASVVCLIALVVLMVVQTGPVLAQQGVTRSQTEAVGNATENQLRQTVRPPAAPQYPRRRGTYQSSWAGYPPPPSTYPPPRAYRPYAPYP